MTEFDDQDGNLLGGDEVSTLPECGFAKLTRLAHERTNSDYPDFDKGVDVWSPMQWGCAAAGEMGELCNALKKLERGLVTDHEDIESLLENIGEEAADTLTYITLLLQRVDNYALELGHVRPDYDLREIVANKFNKTSEKIGSKVVWEDY